MDLSKLKDPFPASDIEWRVQQAGEKNDKVWASVLAYVTNRAIMNRLDDVCGQGNWKNEYKEWIGGSVLCGLSIKIDNEWVTKWDGAEQTDFEATKGGLSGAMKRAAVQWGIGRYLYNLEAGFAKVHDKGKHYQAGKKDKYKSFKWDEPELPAWALPKDIFDKLMNDENKLDEEFELDKIQNEINNCTSLVELRVIFESLSKENRIKFNSLKEKKKEELNG